MQHLHLSKRSATRLALPVLLLCGTLALVVGIAATTAGATDCTPTAGEACVDISAGTLTLTAPTTLAFPTTTLTTASQWISDQNAPDQTLVVSDARGSNAGWNVNIKATPFTCSGCSGTPTLGGGFKVNGDTTNNAAVTSPTLKCTVASTCTTPTNSVTYPASITTDGTSTTELVNAAVGTGGGSVTFGDTAPVAWWLEVPPTAIAGSYTSTITLAVSTGP
jgi:hypothetical protein